MRRAIPTAVLLGLVLAPPAFAGTATLGTQSTGDRYDPSRPALVYTAAAGERNDIVVIRVGNGIGVDARVALRDSGAIVAAGPGCSAIDEHAVICPAAAVTIDAGDGDDTVAVPSEARSGSNTNEVYGGSGDDTLRGSGMLDGGPGNDLIEGSPYDYDVLLGGTGDDVLRGGAGDDTLVGDGDGYVKASPDPGGGDDTIDGGDGEDSVLYVGRRKGVRVDLATGTGGGTAGERDRILNVEDVTGGAGADVLLGDGGPNLLEGHPGDDRISGRGGADTLVAGNGADILRGGAGGDRLTTRDRADRLYGDAGDDTLSASSEGANLLRCGADDDTIDGKPHGQSLDGCERVDVGGFAVSVRPRRRSGGGLPFGWSCNHMAAPVPWCGLRLTLRVRSAIVGRRSVSIPSPSQASFVVRPSRALRRGTPVEVTIQGGVGPKGVALIGSSARWHIRL